MTVRQGGREAPLFLSVHRRNACLIKSVPYAPASHPFVERLIGIIRREYRDRIFFLECRRLGAQIGRGLRVLQRPSRSSRARRYPARATRRNVLPRPCLAGSLRFSFTLQATLGRSSSRKPNLPRVALADPQMSLASADIRRYNPATQ